MAKVKVEKKAIDLFLLNLYGTTQNLPKDAEDTALEYFKMVNKDPEELIQFDVEPFTCSVCGKRIEDERGNSPAPLAKGKCCAMCNVSVVRKARIDEYKAETGKE